MHSVVRASGFAGCCDGCCDAGTHHDEWAVRDWQVTAVGFWRLLDGAEGKNPQQFLRCRVFG